MLSAAKAVGAARRRHITLGLTRLILAATLLAGLVPLVLLSVSALAEYQAASAQATATATTALDNTAIAYLRVWSEQVADQMSAFLGERVRDTRTLAILPRTSDAYLAFARNSTGEIWYQTGTAAQPRQVHQVIPMYRELAYVGADGWEKLRVADGQAVPAADLRYVADPATTTYQTETYFADARRLSPGQVSVSHLTAWHTSVAGQPAGQLPPDAAPGEDYGQYVGVFRFATPVFDARGRFDGVVVLSLDARLVVERVIHILPTATDKATVWPDFRGGDYAALFDDEGYLIAHPVLSELRGLDPSGHPIAPLSPSAPPADRARHPFSLIASGDATTRDTYQTVLRHQSTYSVHASTAGISRADFVAPILMPDGVASTTGVFGGVTIGANVAEFHGAAATVRGSIEAEQARLEQRLLLVSALAVAILVATGVVIARGITRPVMRLTEAARVMERGELDTTTLDTLLHRRVVDEVTTLSQVFKRMAEQVQLREQRLRQEIVQLHIRIDERKKQQEISDIVGTDFFRNLQATADSMRSRGRRPGRDDRTEVDS